MPDSLPFGLTQAQIDGATYEASEQEDEVFAVAFLRRIEARLSRTEQALREVSD